MAKPCSLPMLERISYFRMKRKRGSSSTRQSYELRCRSYGFAPSRQSSRSIACWRLLPLAVAIVACRVEARDAENPSPSLPAQATGRLLYILLSPFLNGWLGRATFGLTPSLLEECRRINPRSRATTRKFQKRFLHHDGGPARLQALIFAKSPLSWRLPN